MNDVENKIKSIMSTIFDISSSEIDDKSSSDTISNWDSLKHMNLVYALEEEFDIVFSDKEIVELLNFKLIKLILENKIS